MIDPSEALGVAAQIAVTLTGFTGVVAVFGRGAVHEWDDADLFRLRLLLIASISPPSMCLLALLLLSAELDAALVWRMCSAVAVPVSY